MSLSCFTDDLDLTQEPQLYAAKTAVCTIIDCFVIDSWRLRLTFVVFSVIRQHIAKTIQLLRRPIRAPDQIPDRFYVISMKFLLLRHRRFFPLNVPSGGEREETAVFAGQNLFLKPSGQGTCTNNMGLDSLGWLVEHRICYWQIKQFCSFS